MSSVVSQKKSKYGTSKRKKNKQLIFTLPDIVDAIHNDQIKNIVVLTGAGISTSAGIIDYRSSQGLYSKHPEKINSRSFYNVNPLPFWKIVKNILQINAKPTASHWFIRLLQDKGLLRRLYTQNIDMLHSQTGILSEKLVEAHGNLKYAQCRLCNTTVTFQKIRMQLLAGLSLPRCTKCKGSLDPNVVLYEDDLKPRFYKSLSEDFSNNFCYCDMLIVLGSSLKVAPFCAVANLPTRNAIRLLVNTPLSDCFSNPFNDYSMRKREKISVKLAGRNVQSQSFWGSRDGKWKNEVMLEMKTDDFCWEFVQALGWEHELKKLISFHSSEKYR